MYNTSVHLHVYNYAGHYLSYVVYAYVWIKEESYEKERLEAVRWSGNKVCKFYKHVVLLPYY